MSISTAATDDGFRIRAMRAEEIGLALDWAAAEGWNPGSADASCFASVDPAGFLIGERAGEPASTISVVNYDERFAFLGFYIVRPDLRGRGFGLRTWQAAIAHAGARTIGLDGVVAQQESYRKSGFELAYNNVRYGGVPASLRQSADTVSLAETPFDLIERDDATAFPASRRSFLRHWIAAPGHVGRALLRGGRLVAWGVIRPCRRGRQDRSAVRRRSLSRRSGVRRAGGRDGRRGLSRLPQPNHAAVALAVAHGLAPVFQTARMYSGPIRAVALARVFGVTTFELG